MEMRCPLALQRIEIFDVDAAPLAEQHDQYRQPNGRFGRGDAQYEEYEYLPVDIAQEPRERDEIEIDGQQHQFDAHQQDDDVLAIQEHPGHGDREQDARERQNLGKTDHGRFSAGILTTRTRSLARTATWAETFCGLPPMRGRSVSTMAATLATSKMTATSCAGYA